MLGALGELEVNSDIWEQVLQQGLDVLPDLVDEPLAVVTRLVLKAASKSQQLGRAVRTPVTCTARVSRGVVICCW